jgi:acetylornithine deacetylase/succinyl-diaminopimelate desuccinylase-like protein
LGKEYSKAQIIVTGVLGPKTNAHGPNEHIDLGYTLKFTQAVAHVLASTALHYAQ